MYNGIGLTTVRGTATSGYVSKNLSYVKPEFFRNKLDSNTGKHANSYNRNYKSKENESKLATNRSTVSQNILDHNRKFALESKLFELREKLEEAGTYSSEEIEEEIKKYREKYERNQMQLSSSSNNYNNIEGSTTDSYVVNARKEQENNRLKDALGIGEDFVPGAAFDPEIQEQRRLQREEDRKLKQENYEKEKLRREEERIRRDQERERREKEREIRDKEAKERAANSRREREEEEVLKGKRYEPKVRDYPNREDRRRSRGQEDREGEDRRGVRRENGRGDRRMDRREDGEKDDLDRRSSYESSRRRYRSRSRSGSRVRLDSRERRSRYHDDDDDDKYTRRRRRSSSSRSSTSVKRDEKKICKVYRDNDDEEKEEGKRKGKEAVEEGEVLVHEKEDVVVEKDPVSDVPVVPVPKRRRPSRFSSHLEDGYPVTADATGEIVAVQVSEESSKDKDVSNSTTANETVSSVKEEEETKLSKDSAYVHDKIQRKNSNSRRSRSSSSGSSSSSSSGSSSSESSRTSSKN